MKQPECPSVYGQVKRLWVDVFSHMEKEEYCAIFSNMGEPGSHYAQRGKLG